MIIRIPYAHEIFTDERGLANAEFMVVSTDDEFEALQQEIRLYGDVEITIITRRSSDPTDARRLRVTGEYWTLMHVGSMLADEYNS